MVLSRENSCMKTNCIKIGFLQTRWKIHTNSKNIYRYYNNHLVLTDRDQANVLKIIMKFIYRMLMIFSPVFHNALLCITLFTFVVVLHPTAKELIIGVTLYSGDLNAWMGLEETVNNILFLLQHLQLSIFHLFMITSSRYFMRILTSIARPI